MKTPPGMEAGGGVDNKIYNGKRSNKLKPFCTLFWC